MAEKPGESDWSRILGQSEGEAIPYESGDGPYDPNDPLAATAWLDAATVLYKGKVLRRGQRGPQKLPTKRLVSLRLSPEVLEHFQATGKGWQSRIDETLRQAIHKEA
jgi:uncharacterized protein (DUF4415 family)